MPKKLFLLDGMALVYRAHFAFIRRPILTSQGVNTSALYGFTNTLLDILNNHQPTHIAVAFDTAAPTERHEVYEEYKAQREEMPEDLSDALPHVERMIEAFNIPVLTMDGYEADDIIGTLVRRAEKEGYESYMVTPDKDFGQLIDENTFMLKPSRGGDGSELLKLPEIRERWGIERPDQVIDILGLMGDASDNIPGIPGIGEKTAIKLIGQFGTVENLLQNTDKLKGKQKERVEENKEQALLSKRLATINCEVPVDVDVEDLQLQDRDDEAIKALCVEFEFNSLGKRLFGDAFKAGRGQGGEDGRQKTEDRGRKSTGRTADGQGDLFLSEPAGQDKAPAKTEAKVQESADSNHKNITQVAHDYQLITTAEDRAQLLARLGKQPAFCFDSETTSLDPQQARLLGLSFSFEPHQGFYVAFPEDTTERQNLLAEFKPLFADQDKIKVGHNLKYDLSVLRWNGLEVAGPLVDTMIMHFLVEPDQRHGMDYLAEVYLDYSPIPITRLIGEKKSEQKSLTEVPLEELAEYATEDADVTWQLHRTLEPLLKEKCQDKVFYDIEAPLLPVLTAMECEGVKVDASALAEFSESLSHRIEQLEKDAHKLATREFNLKSPKQLGEVLFDELKVSGKPKKTKTGQYSTDEQTLQTLADEHAIVGVLLEYRTLTKLKSTYADTLPEAIAERTGRVHTTFHQVVTATGRLASQNPNLQNIPIRTDLGQEIRKAFVPRDENYLLLSADYSQIELRIIAALSKDSGMMEAFNQGIDIHTATAAKVHGVPLDDVDSTMRRQAKMVNFGIIYGISAFGLSQRLSIPRGEAAAIIEQYFKEYPAIQKYMSDTIEGAKERGYVETITGRRRYIRDINSANATVRNGAERMAINTPIQGSAADMIKLAMIGIHDELNKRHLKTRMLLQVHDELVFDLFKEEEGEVRAMVEDKMKNAIAMDVPIEVEIGTGTNWLEAH